MIIPDIFRLRLTSHQLGENRPGDIRSLVSRMGALQAQDYTMSKWAIGIRLPGINDHLVEAAIAKGEILRTHILRPTWHWVAAENIRWILQLTAPRIKAAVAIRDKQLGLGEPIFEKSNRWIREILSGNNQLTRMELQNELAQRGLKTDAFQMAHLSMRAELDAIICSGATKNKRQTYRLIDEVVPETPSLSREEALGKLTHLFFTSHGPATPDDFSWWSGLSKTEVKQGLGMNKSGLISEKWNSREYWLSPDLPMPESEPVHFLPAFDEFIVSYKDRTDILPLDYYHYVITSNGIFKPVIISGNQIIGIWKMETKKSKTKIIPSFFPLFNQISPDSAESAMNRVRSFYTGC